jgi:hypothetical protein
MVGQTLSCRKLCTVTQFIYAEHFHPSISLPVNAGVWWWCAETASCRERVKRVQKWDGIHHDDCTFQPGRLRTCEHSVSGGIGLGKPTRHNMFLIHCSGEICENCTQHCPSTTGIQQRERERECVCVCVYTKMYVGSSQTLMFGGAPSLLQSFKGVANRFPESVVTLWDMDSPVCSKWALMQGTHPSSRQPQNVKCGSMLEGCGICILCWRSHQHWIYALRLFMECEHMLRSAITGPIILHCTLICAEMCCRKYNKE